MCGILEHFSGTTTACWSWQGPWKFPSPALCLRNEETEARTKRKVAKLDITPTMCCGLYLLTPVHLLRQMILISFYRKVRLIVPGEKVTEPRFKSTLPNSRLNSCSSTPGVFSVAQAAQGSLRTFQGLFEVKTIFLLKTLLPFSLSCSHKVPRNFFLLSEK